MLYEMSMLFPVRRRTRTDEATVCMLSNDYRALPYWNTVDPPGRLDTLYRNVFAPVSLTKVSSFLFFFLENGRTICNRIQKATSSAAPADDGCGSKSFGLFLVLIRSIPVHAFVAGQRRLQQRNQLKYFRSCLFFVLPSVFRAKV